LARMAEEQGIAPRRLTPELQQVLGAYDWPGNVRELLNLLERLVYTVDTPEIGSGDLPPGLAHRLQPAAGVAVVAAGAGRTSGSDLGWSVAEAERAAVRQALEACRGSKAKAARVLGIHRSTLYDKLRKYGLE